MTYNYSIIDGFKIPARVGIQSLVGVMGQEYPFSRGNYFDFRHEKEPYCVNMWSENMTEAVKRFLPDKMVEVDIITVHYDGCDYPIYYAVVVDDRIPKEWLHDSPYFCGVASLPPDALKDLVYRYDWNYEKTEKYIDPVSYYGKQSNTTYNPETGVVITTLI